MDLLKSQYFNTRHPIAYAGVDKVYKWFKQNGYSLSRSKIRNWLESLEDYSVHQPVKRRFIRKRVISPYPGYMIDADMAFYIKYANRNDGYKYTLLCIDVFSRFVWATPLKSKKPGELIEAFKDLMEKGIETSHLRTDKSSDLTSRKTEAFFKSRNINHFVTENELKTSFAERAIKTIKNELPVICPLNRHTDGLTF